MKYFANWQPLINEDRHTALVFGFLRHAPKEHALNPWLSQVLDRPVRVERIRQLDFWPTLPSVVPGSVTTQPELVFDAHDPEPLKVVVEVKPGYGQQMLDQVSREVVDVANATGASRIACVMVGADLGAPMKTGEWEREIRRALVAHLPGRSVSAELKYASFASLGKAARRCADACTEWSSYADDVVAQLHHKALLGYDGAPVLDDLDSMTLPNATQAFNRAILSARLFFLQLHTQPQFQALSLRPFGKDHQMFRNGNSKTPTQQPAWFETTVAMCLYRNDRWDNAHIVFVGFDLLGRDGQHADVIAGACRYTSEITYGFQRADFASLPQYPILKDCSDPFLPFAATEAGSDWRFDRRPWKSGQSNEDITWAIDRLRSAIDLWDQAATETRGLTHDDFNGKSDDTLRHWFKWWTDPARSPDGKAEGGRDPAEEAAKLERELTERAKHAASPVDTQP